MSVEKHFPLRRWSDERLVAAFIDGGAGDPEEMAALKAEIHRRADRDARRLAVALGNLVPEQADPKENAHGSQ